MIEKTGKSGTWHFLKMFFAPAQWLIDRLHFRIRLGLLAVIVIVAFGLVFTGPYKRLNRVIENSQQELIGLDLLPPLYLVIERIQEYRGLSLGVLSGGTELENAMLQKQQSVTRAFEVVERVLPPALLGSVDWQEIHGVWQRIIKQNLTGNAAGNFSEQNLLIDRLLRFGIGLADRFFLTSQPDVGIHYLLLAVLNQLPAQLGSLVRLRDTATGMLAQRQTTRVQRAQVDVLRRRAKSAMLLLQQDLEHAGQLNVSIQPRLASAMQRLLAQSGQVFTQLQIISQVENSGIRAADFFQLATTAVSTGYGIVYQDLVPEMRALIRQRLNEAKKTRINYLIIAAAGLLLVLYFAIGMYLSVLRSIQYIARTAGQLAKGDLSRRLQVGTRSEVKGLADGINDLVDELTRLIRLEKEGRERVQAVVDSSQDALVRLNAQGMIIGWSHQAQNNLGWTPKEALGRDSWQVLIPAPLRDQHLLRIDHFLTTGDAALLNEGIETEVLHRNGHSIVAEVSLAPVRTGQGYEFNVYIRDISLRKQSELHEITRRAVLEKLLNNESLGSILEAITKAVEQENPDALCSILLLDQEGKQLQLGAAPSLPDYFNEANDGFAIGEDAGCCGAAAYRGQRVIIEDLQAHPNCFAARELVIRAQLRSCWSEPIFGADAKVLGVFTIYRRLQGQPGVTDFALIEYASQLTALAIERHQANQRLLLSSRIFAETGEGITVTDVKGTILDVNPAFSTITGYSRSEVLGKNPSILKSGKQSEAFYTGMWQQIREQGSWQGEIWNRRKNGELYAEMLTISSIMSEEHKVSHYVGLFSDITLSKEQQKALEFMAHYDVLTALPNRNLFADRLNQAISRSKRKQTLLAVCFLDLDNFKLVNDQYGHDVGDRLLVEVAGRIRANIREEDTACRQGGDEFILLLQELETVFQCEQMLKRICETVSKPYLIDDYHHRISVSAGVTLYPMDDADPDMLVRHADQAMYQAKLEGKNRYHLFDVAEDQQTLSRHQQLQTIENALQQHQFCLYYQPKVNMATGAILGVEALIRWQHPQQGLLMPDVFLPQVEGTALEISIGDWVIEQALEHSARAKKARSVYQVSINVSTRYLQTADFAGRLQRFLAQYPEVDPDDIQLEILESSALGDLQVISGVIKKCREVCGVQIALDDFGTGYSSLTHMRNLPADTIKIDRSFVDCLLDDVDDYAIVDGVIALATSFNSQVLAEGVETEEQGLMLLLMGCDQAQGYAIARPMPAQELMHWVQGYQPNPVWQKLQVERLGKRENQLHQYTLLLRYWLDCFNTKIQASPKDGERWPALSGNSQLGIWMQRARREQRFSSVWLDQLEAAQQQLFAQAQLLYGHCKKGEVSAARIALPDLHAVADVVFQRLESAVDKLPVAGKS